MMSEDEKRDTLKQLNQKLTALIEEEEDWIANLANTAALLYNELKAVNWAGFYLLKDDELVLGPFQGLPACVRIKPGNGVCGSVVQDQKTYVVPDVHQFSNHITCDPASEAEIVVPMFFNGDIVGVLDIDSPEKGRFTEVDARYLEKFVTILIEGSAVTSC